MKVWPNMTQGSEEWFQARTGKLTASNASKILTAGGKASTQRGAYIDELISDCLCPGQNAWGGNFATERGTAMEPIARQQFIQRSGLEVNEVGFVTVDEHGIVGCSPDGLVVGDLDNYVAGLEIKCPLPKTHYRYLLEGVLPDTYKPQVHFSMMVTGLPWHFFSYCPGMKPLDLYIEPDSYTEKLRAMIDAFLLEYSAAWETAKRFREEDDA